MKIVLSAIKDEEATIMNPSNEESSIPKLLSLFSPLELKTDFRQAQDAFVDNTEH